MSSPAKLTYFYGRGIGELVRIVLGATGVEFTDVFVVERDQFLQRIDCGILPFGQIPLLEIDGLRLVQSQAIARYLAKRAGIYGNDLTESAKIDMYFEGSRDFYAFFMQFGFAPEDEVVKTIKEKGFARYLPAYEKILKQSGTGFLVGNTISLADLGLLEPLLWAEEYFGSSIFKDYPLLEKWFKTVQSDAKVSAFLKGPHRMPKNDAEMCAKVKRVLGRA